MQSVTIVSAVICPTLYLIAQSSAQVEPEIRQAETVEVRRAEPVEWPRAIPTDPSAKVVSNVWIQVGPQGTTQGTNFYVVTSNSSSTNSALDYWNVLVSSLTKPNTGHVAPSESAEASRAARAKISEFLKQVTVIYFGAAALFMVATYLWALIDAGQHARWSWFVFIFLVACLCPVYLLAYSKTYRWWALVFLLMVPNFITQTSIRFIS